MSAIATAVVGGSLISGALSSSASESAANTQANASDTAAADSLAATQSSNQLQYQMYLQGLQNQTPYLTGGQEAESALLGALGLSAPSAADIKGSTSATPGSAGYNAKATNYGATQSQLNSANAQDFGALTGTFNNADLNAQLAPNYEFQLQQGEQALQASMAATGTLQTGQGLKNINDYAQNSAASAYQQAFNNYTTQQNNLYSRLAGVAGVGSSTANAIANSATSTGANIANTTMSGTAAANSYLTGAAAAQAAGTVGSANAISGAIGSGINGYMGSQILNSYLNNNTNQTFASVPSGGMNTTGSYTPTVGVNTFE